VSKWAKARLEDCCRSISDGDHLPPPKTDSGIPFVTISDIHNNRFDLSNTRFVPEAYYEAIDQKRKIQKGDVLYSVVGSYGIPVFADESLKVAFQRHIAILRPSEEIEPRFLYYSMLNRDFFLKADAVAVGAAQKTITLAALRGLEIALPPLPIQRRIAAILSDYDSAIDNARRQIALLEEAAMRLYREWFVVKANPKWEKGAVRKWFEITIGRTPPRKIAANFSESATDQKWCSIKDLQNSNIFISETAERLTKQGVDSSKIHISPAGTIFLSFKLTVGKVAITLEPMATNEAIAHFETIDRALRDYTYCYLHEFQYDTLGSTSSIGKAINSEIVRDMPFVMPDAKTLTRFSDMVSPIFDQIQNSVVFIRTLTEARDRLLPKLMSGEIEV
jgi:type I restriction enzyme S subunit